MVKIEVYRSGCKNTQISEKNLEIENIMFLLSKTGLRMSIRHLDRFLWPKVAPAFLAILTQKGIFRSKIAKIAKIAIFIWDD